MTAQIVKVPFRGEELFALEKDGERYIPLSPYCARLGVDLESQRKKLKSVSWTCPVIITAQMPGDDQERPIACIPLRALPMWLASINPGKVAPEIRPVLVAYQKEAAEVLYKHFLGGSVPSVEIAALRAELAELRAELRAPRPAVSSLPVTGPVDARVYILGPLRQIARKQARLDGSRWRSIYKSLDNELREATSYPMVRDASWEMMPRDKLAIAHRKVTRWQRDVDARTARMLDGAPPKQLPLST